MNSDSGQRINTNNSDFQGQANIIQIEEQQQMQQANNGNSFQGTEQSENKQNLVRLGSNMSNNGNIQNVGSATNNQNTSQNNAGLNGSYQDLNNSSQQINNTANNYNRPNGSQSYSSRQIQRDQIENLLTEDYGRILGKVKRERKEIEEEAQNLANRIALLKQEELKGWKKIEETKKKTQDILKMKKLNEQKQKETIQMKEIQESQVLNHKSSNTDLKQRKKDQMDSIRRDLEKNRYENYVQIKQMREMNEMKKQKFLEFQQEIALRQHQRVKEEEQKSKRKINNFKIKQKKIVIQTHYQNEIEQEQKEKMRKQQEILEMQKLESELINRLHSTQIQQKNAFQELEGLLNMKVDEYENQYKKKKNNHSHSIDNLRAESKQQINQPSNTENAEFNNGNELPYINNNTNSLPKLKKFKKKKRRKDASLPKERDFIF